MKQGEKLETPASYLGFCFQKLKSQNGERNCYQEGNEPAESKEKKIQGLG
jgi:hypothetical protein